MPSFIIGFKQTKAAITKVPAEAMGENPVRYFQYKAVTTPTIKTIKHIVHYMTEAYPDMTHFPVSKDAPKLLFDAKDFYSPDRDRYLNYFLVPCERFYEIHSRVKTPSDYILNEMADPTVEEFKTDEESEDESTDFDLKSLLKVFPLHGFSNFTRIGFQQTEQLEEFPTIVDENLMPEKKLLVENSIQAKTNETTFTAIQKLYLETKTLLLDTQAINATAMAEAKQYEGELQELTEDINAELALANKLNNRVDILETQMYAHYDNLLDDRELINWRMKLIKSLWACALFSAQGTINFIEPATAALTKFNFQFAKIATIKTVAKKPTLVFDYNIQHLSFTQLQDLSNSMLNRIYQKGNITLFLGYDWSNQIKFFAQIIGELFSNFAVMDIKTNAFNWNWKRLHSYSEKLHNSAMTANTEIKDELGNQSEKLDNLVLRLTSIKQAVTEINAKNKMVQKKLDQNDQSISDNVSSARSMAHSMNDEYLRVNHQLQTLQQVLNDLLVLSAKFSLPYATMEDLITQAESLQTKMQANMVIAKARSSDLFITSRIAGKVQTQAEQVSDKQMQFAKAIQPLNEMNDLVTSINRIMTAQQSAINSKDNLIAVTRKFASLLADVEYFHSLVNWGGTKIVVADTSYSVPKSYSELLNLRNSLTDPMRFEDVTTFWTEAKKIVTLAEKRTSYRYFFIFYKKVRSPEMEALLKLIKDLDIDNIPAPNHIDAQLNDIKPDWREDQLSSVISIRVNSASRPNPSVSSLRNLSLTGSFDRPDSPVDISPVPAPPSQRPRGLVV